MVTSFSLIFLSILGVSFAESEYTVIFDNKVSNGDARLIVDKHNELRKLIANGRIYGQPRGINLKRMKYDKDLAVEAQKIANTYSFAHKPVHDVRWNVGQNLFTTHISANINNFANWSLTIQSWFDEHEGYTFGQCCKHGSKQTGHYTQLVWAETEYVGCGYTYFNNEVTGYQKLYVCNYGPAGNIVGRFPYIVGKSGCEQLC